jgi:cell division transport system permease protein
MSLVLFLIGVVGVLVLNAHKVSVNLKENFVITAFLKDSSKKQEINKLQKFFELSDYVNYTEFVSKDEAANRLKGDLGENFMDFLGYNPLKNSLDIKLKADFVSPEQIKNIEKDLVENKIVEEVVYDEFLIEQMAENLEKVSLWLAVFAAMFLFVSIGLINSSIRLSIYSKRFLIKTMQLVGATKSFIRWPFILQNIRLGVLASFLALILLSGLLYYIDENFQVLANLDDLKFYGIIYGGIILIGIVISAISTFFAMNKYLSLKTEELYY